MDQYTAASDLAETMRANCLAARVTRLHRVVARAYEQALRPLGLTQPQLEILSTLIIMTGPVKPSDLADSLMLERSSINRNLAIMEAKGWVAAAGTSLTGRTMTVAITESGIDMLASAKTGWQKAQASVVTSLGSGTPATLDSWLELLAAMSAVQADVNS